MTVGSCLTEPLLKTTDDPDHKKILNNLSGYAKPGELTAIMGASGSGKTSLLNVIG